MELNETINLMCSNDYKDRFKAEYYQLDIRCKKLETIINKFQDGKLDFKPDCPIELLKQQLEDMENYKWDLYARAQLENINLEDNKEPTPVVFEFNDGKTYKGIKYPKGYAVGCDGKVIENFKIIIEDTLED